MSDFRTQISIEVARCLMNGEKTGAEIARALIAAGVVADPDHLHAALVALHNVTAEKQRARAALHDIAETIREGEHPDDWGVTCVYTDRVWGVFARHGIETAALELPPNSPTGTVGHIDTEEPQP